MANTYKDYIVCTNAIKEGLGGVISQEGHVVCYESHNLKDHEQNYVVHELELATVVHALKMWCHYLLGKKFILLTYTTCIKHMFTHLGLNSRHT